MLENEGWVHIETYRTWHYYRNKTALCGKMTLFVHPEEYVDGDYNNVPKCKLCEKLLKRENV